MIINKSNRTEILLLNRVMKEGSIEYRKMLEPCGLSYIFSCLFNSQNSANSMHLDLLSDFCYNEQGQYFMVHLSFRINDFEIK